MHMANELLTPTVALGSGLIALAGIGLAARRIAHKADSNLVPLMGVMGAFVFAAQMINFTLPAMAGTSDHMVGTMFLAILLGPSAAVITMAGVLLIQCLVFQDGGLLALGANIINMGILPAYAGYAIWRLMIGHNEKLSMGRLIPAAWTSAFVAVALGAAAVCVEVGLSNMLTIPLATFSLAMIGVLLISGAIEGLITCAVLIFLYRLYPNLALRTIDWQNRRLEMRSVLILFTVLAAVIGLAISWLASPYADGLDWAVYERQSGALKAKTALAEKVDDLQARYSLLPDYNKRDSELGKTAPQEPDEQTQATSWPNVDFWTSFSGILGVGLTMGLIWGVGRLLAARRNLKAG